MTFRRSAALSTLGRVTTAPEDEAAPQRVTPEPMEVNDVAIVAVGTALFAVAFIVLIALHGPLQHDGRGHWPWVALSGFLLGLIGLLYCTRRARRIRSRDAQ